MIKHDNDEMVTPSAKQLARNFGIDIRDITGTGHHGLVLVKDVEAYLATQADAKLRAEKAQGDNLVVADMAAGNGPSFINVSPLAIRVAQNEGVDLSLIPRGSGQGGRIVKKDVLAFKYGANGYRKKVQQPVAEPQQPAAATPPVDEAAQAEPVQSPQQETATIAETYVEEVMPAAQAKPEVAAEASSQAAPAAKPGEQTETKPPQAKEQVAASKTPEEPAETTPEGKEPMTEQNDTANCKRHKHGRPSTITLRSEIDMTEVKELRKDISKKMEKATGYRCAYTDFLYVAVLRALEEFPGLAATLTPEGLVQNDTINLGFGAVISDELQIPVLQAIDSADFETMVLERNELLKRIKAGEAGEKDYSGGNFHVFNLGLLGIIEGSLNLRRGNVAGLTVGEVVDRVRSVKGEMTTRSVMKVCLRIDDRHLSPVTGARFLQHVKENMESPAVLLLR